MLPNLDYELNRSKIGVLLLFANFRSWTGLAFKYQAEKELSLKSKISVFATSSSKNIPYPNQQQNPQQDPL